MVYNTTRLFSLLAGTALAALTGCATVSSGTTQAITVLTPDADGAACVFEDKQGGSWRIDATPGSVTMTKNNGSLTLTCRRDGFRATTVLIEPKLDDKSYGNVYLGGLGLLVDAVSGAVVRYPSTVTVQMLPSQY